VHVARVNQHHLKTTRFKDFVERNPVDSGRFHRHGLDAALDKPVGQALKLCGERAELTYRFRVAFDWNRHEVTALTTVDAGGVRPDALK